MQPLTIAGFLIFCSLILLFLELLVPSGGIISIIAALCVLAAIVASFFAGTTTGLYFTGGTTLATAIGIYLFFKFWPRTPMGRKIVMQPLTQDEIIDAAQRGHLSQFVGQQGLAKSVMRPAGLVLLDDETFDAVSDGLPIEAGDPVEVIAVRMNRLVVSPIEETAESDEAARLEDDDPLAQSIDALGLDPLDDPLG